MNIIDKKIGKKTNEKSQKGITLIALVISIIVLLILAGVSISMITGQNSIMEKVQDAVVKTKNAEELEKVQLAVVNAMARGTTGGITRTILNEELNKMGLNQVPEGVAPWEVTGSQGTYTISANGSVEPHFSNGGGDPTGTPTVVSYTVIYETYGAKEIVSNETVKTSGSTVTLPTLTKDNYVFQGWYTAQTGGTKVGDGEDSYTVIGSITLHAQWIEEPKYTITYNANGGSGTMSPTMDYSPQVLSNAFTAPVGKSFLGWNTSADGNGNSYNVGDVISANIELFAQWSWNSFNWCVCLVEGSGEKKIISDGYQGVMPSKVYINGIRQDEIKKAYFFDTSDNIVELCFDTVLQGDTLPYLFDGLNIELMEVDVR